MLKIDTLPATASVQEMQRNYRKLLDKVKSSRRPLFLLRNNFPEAVIVDVQSWEELASRVAAKEYPAARLSQKEQKTLIIAKQKIKAIQDDMINSAGLTSEEAAVAAKAGLIGADQQWWWLEEWQEGEREAERDIKEGRVETLAYQRTS